MLRFITGEKGSGKTEYCIKDAAHCGNASLLIVPEQFSHNAEMDIVKKMGVFGLGSMEVLSFGQLARRVMATSENAAMRHIDNAGKVMLIYKILKGDNFVLLSGNEEEKAVCLMEIIGEFKRYCVTADDLEGICEKFEDGILKSKLQEIIRVYKKFEEKVKDKFINTDDNLERLAMSEYARKKYSGYNIYIDSFTSFTKAEVACIEMFMEICESVNITMCMDAENKRGIHFTTCISTVEQLKNAAKKKGIAVCEDVALKGSATIKSDLKYLSREYFNPGATSYEGDADSMEMFMGKNLISEIEFTAANIRRMVKEKGYYYRDFAVLCSDADLYSEYIKTIFEKYDIKVFPDVKTNVANHPVASFIISALDIICRGYTYQNMFRCIKYDFFDIEDEQCDILENFALESGALGSMWSDCEKWTEYVYDFFKKNYNESEEVNDRADRVTKAGIKIIAPIARFRKNLSSSGEVREKCKALYSFLEDVGVKEKLLKAAEYFESISDNYSAIEYKSVYNKVMDVLEEMCDALGDEKLSNENFAAILKTGIGQFEIGKIPAVKDGVICGSIQMAKELDVPVVFVLGMNDGVFPSPVNKSGFLNDNDRQRLESEDIKLAPESKVSAIENEYLIYRIITSAKDKIFFCYSMANPEGSGLREAWAIKKIKNIMPKIKMTDNIMKNDPYVELAAPKAAFEKMMLSLSGSKRDREEYKAAYKWFKENEVWAERTDKAVKMLKYRNTATPVDREDTDKIYGDEMITAVSRLEKFSACPFSHFMRYVLKAQPRKEYKFQPKDAGTFLHGIIERFSQRLEESGRAWNDVNEEYIKREIEQILLDDNGVMKRGLSVADARGERAFVRLCKTAEFAIGVMAEHINRGKFQPMGYEIKFSDNGKIKPVTIELPYGKKVKLTGIIDRMDALDTENGTYFRIIDYKTGNKKFDLGEMYNGISLQLAVYMCAASENGGKPGGMLYFRLADPAMDADPFLEDEQIKEERRGKVKLSGLLVDSEEVLNSMDVSGKFDFLPARKLKSGRFSGDIASEVNFRELQKFVKKKVASLAAEIYSGKNSIAPYKIGDSCACDFCDFSDACKFDKALGCEYRTLMSESKEEIWQKIGENNEC